MQISFLQRLLEIYMALDFGIVVLDSTTKWQMHLPVYRALSSEGFGNNPRVCRQLQH